MRMTKIVATIGPASSEPSTIRTLINAGVDVFRLNFSHGTRDSHRATFSAIREACAECGKEVAILQDLCGPKIRVGEMRDGAVELVDGSEVTITTRAVTGTEERFSTSYKSLVRDVRPDAPILLDDGAIELKVLAASGDDVRCQVVSGGILKSRKGMNLPNTEISSPSVTQKDARDMVVGLEEGVDFIALSFVRHPDDIRKVRRTLEKHEKSAQIIAKIEKPEAIEHLDEIIAEADGIMVARGDLGVEMDLAAVPMLQKDIIRRANEADKYVITATQMLESMIKNPSPTRAEVTDVANAIIDGTDALMLSGETAVGEHPGGAVRMLDKIARRTESYLKQHRPAWNWTRLNPRYPLQDAIGHAAYKLYEDLSPKAICAFSATGGTSLFLSKSRPFSPILAFTARAESLRRMRLFWGVEPIMDPEVMTKEALFAHANNYIRTHGIAADGDCILMIAGSHFGQCGSNNCIEVATIGEPEQEEPKPRGRSTRRIAKG